MVVWFDKFVSERQLKICTIEFTKYLRFDCCMIALVSPFPTSGKT